MRLLDLFCGAGGCAVGYHRAGFTDILGVDNLPKPRYPFRLVQADALEFLDGVKPGDFDMIHASPPCQSYSIANNLWGREYPELVEPIRGRLIAIGTPYVIENVVGAPLIDPICLCGLMFDLKVFRHRLFETTEFLLQPPHIPHRDRRIGNNGFCCVAGNGDSGNGRIPKDHRTSDAWRRAMGIDWMTRDELAQAIPPAYTEWIGREMLARIR